MAKRKTTGRSGRRGDMKKIPKKKRTWVRWAVASKLGGLHHLFYELKRDALFYAHPQNVIKVRVVEI